MRFKTEATSLKTVWSQSFGNFFDQGVGLVVGWVLAVIGIVIALGVILGWILKAAGRSGTLVNMFASSAKATVAFVLISVILVSPKVLLPAFLSCWDALNTWGESKVTDVLNQASMLHDVAPLTLGE